MWRAAMSTRTTRHGSGDVDGRRRPPPDGAHLEDDEVGVTDLHARDYADIVKRSAKRAVDDQLPDAAAAIAYYSFLAIPAVLLIAVGVFSLFASPSAIETIVERVGRVTPDEAVALLQSGLTRTAEEGGGVTMILVGGLVAVWTASGAANAVMRALNRVYDTDESRGFVKQRLLGLTMVLVGIVAFALVFGLLVLGPKLSGWIGESVGAADAVQWAWLLGEWPILLVGLLVAFGAILFLGPDVERPRWRFLTVGAGVAVALWLAASGGFAIYVSLFGSYNQTWGTLAAVIIMLTWLWLSALALLFAAEVDAEAERTRQRASVDA